MAAKPNAKEPSLSSARASQHQKLLVLADSRFSRARSRTFEALFSDHGPKALGGVSSWIANGDLLESRLLSRLADDIAKGLK